MEISTLLADVAAFNLNPNMEQSEVDKIKQKLREYYSISDDTVVMIGPGGAPTKIWIKQIYPWEKIDDQCERKLVDSLCLYDLLDDPEPNK